MTIENDDQLQALRRIGRVVARCLKQMSEQVRPGITTGELDEIGARYLAEHGARSAPIFCYDFPGHTCISVNDEVAHGIPGDRVLEIGDLVHIDVSAELDGYFSDTGASLVVGGDGGEKMRLCNATRQALNAALRAARAGAPVRAIGRAVEEVAARTGYTVIRNLGSHGIGLTLHDEPKFVPSFDHPEESRILEQGTVMTLEPFLTTGEPIATESEDGWTLRNVPGSLTAQYEHTVVVTRGRPLVLTQP